MGKSFFRFGNIKGEQRRDVMGVTTSMPRRGFPTSQTGERKEGRNHGQKKKKKLLETRVRIPRNKERLFLGHVKEKSRRKGLLRSSSERDEAGQ